MPRVKEEDVVGNERQPPPLAYLRPLPSAPALQEELLPTLRELGIGIGMVAYSPLGRGFLTGAIKSPADLADDDWRKGQPRFTQEAIDKARCAVLRCAALCCGDSTHGLCVWGSVAKLLLPLWWCLWLQNLKLVEEVKALAAAKGCTPGALRAACANCQACSAHASYSS